MTQHVHEHIQAGNWAQAESACRDIIADDANHAEALFLLAQARMQQGDQDEPIALLEQVAQLEPFNANVFHAQGVLYINRGELDDAERYFHQALGINPSHSPSRNGLAFIELATGRFEAAEHSATMLLNDAPEDPQALTYLGTALLEQGKHREAQAYLQEAMRLAPDFPNAQAQLGRAFLADGQSGFAMQCFENVLAKYPDAVDLLEYLGRAQLANGMGEEALASLRRSVQGGRANPELYRDLARLEVGAGNPMHAEALLDAALQMEPGREDVLAPYAEMLLARGENTAVIDRLLPLAEEGTESDIVYSLLAGAYLAEDKAAEARRWVEPRARQADAPLDSVLAYAQVLAAEGESDRADAVLETLLAQESPPLKARLLRARNLFQAGDESCIEPLLSLAGEPELDATQRIKVGHMLGDALHRAGRYEDAAEHYSAVANRHAEVLTIDHGLFEEGAELPESAMDPRVASSWPNAPMDDGLPEPVFVIGWPGSGQERLLPALAAHPDLQLVLDPGPSQAARRALVDRPRGAEALNALTDEDIGRARAAYWQALGSLGADPEAGRVVDAMWLTVESLPTLYRLFPEATILVAERDPKDMSVAWLQGGYQHLNIMTQAYSMQLRLLQQCMDSVPLLYQRSDYDAVQADPRGQLESVVQALGVDWNDTVLEAWVETPMPVIAESGDWKHYADPSLEEDAEGDAPTVH